MAHNVSRDDSGYSDSHARWQARIRWFRSGIVAGGIGGALLVVLVTGLSMLFINEQAVSATLFGIFLGGAGCFLYVHGTDMWQARQRLDEARKQMAYLTRKLEAHEADSE